MPSAEENYFHRLPTEVILYIFDKIIDAKCLCICSSVSKLFAALVLHTRFISVQIRITGLASWSWSPGIHKFLKNLSCVEYVSIQFSCDFELPRSLPLHVYKSDSSSFILVSAKSLIDDTTSIDPMLEATCDPEIEYRHALLHTIVRHMFLFKHRFAFEKELIALFPNLKNIWAVESTELGTIVWEEDIARRTKEKLLKDFCVKLWTAPLVKLPCSGCAMKDAILISIQEIEAGREMNCFEEDEYRELASTMMKEYPCKEISFLQRGVPALDVAETTGTRLRPPRRKMTKCVAEQLGLEGSYVLPTYIE